MNKETSDAPVWSRICAEDVLRSIWRDRLMSWLQPTISSLETVGVKMSKESGVEPDFASLARGLAELMQADGDPPPLPLPIRESLWVIGGLCDPLIMPEVLDSLGTEAVPLQINGDPKPADCAVWLWLKDRKRAIRIYNQHHDDKPDYHHPIDEERLEDEGRAAASEVLRRSPPRAFRYWQDILGKLPLFQNEADKVKLQAEGDALREWFEGQGHWRDLKPNAKDLDPDDHNAHAKHKKQIEDYVAARKTGLRVIEYDKVKPAHKCQHEGTEYEQVDYHWTYLLADEPQVILTIETGNVLPPHNDPLKRHYFKTSAPCGYAILEAGDRLDGAVFFPNGEHVAFTPCFDARFYPEELFQAGDYEFRRVGKMGTTFEGIQAGILDLKQDVEVVRQNTEAIAKNEYELRQENAELRELAEGGFLRFATRVEADDFRAFAAIMLTGNRNQAAQALTIPHRSFYDLVNSWPSRGPDYKRMYRMMECCKKAGRKIKVRLDDSLLGTEVEGQAENPETIRDVLASMRDKTDTKNRDDLLRDILQAMARQNANNWRSVQAEVIAILKEEVSQ